MEIENTSQKFVQLNIMNFFEISEAPKPNDFEPIDVERPPKKVIQRKRGRRRLLIPFHFSFECKRLIWNYKESKLQKYILFASYFSEYNNIYAYYKNNWILYYIILYSLCKLNWKLQIYNIKKSKSNFPKIKLKIPLTWLC